MSDNLVCRKSGCHYGPDGGPYETDAQATSYQAKLADLKIHIDMDHEEHKAEPKEVDTSDMTGNLTCRKTGCSFGPENGPYQTNPLAKTYNDKVADLKMHFEMDHEKEDKNDNAKEKIDTKIDRPSIKATVTDVEWLIFESKRN